MARATGWASTAAAIAVTLLAGCGNQRSRDPGRPAETTTACVRCHGGTDNQTGAPPVSVTGKTDPSFPGVGAHSAHVSAGALAGAYECTACHPDPRSGSTQHGDGVVELTFGALATANGQLKPAHDAATNQCSNVYCHGATLTGGAVTAPDWTKVGQGQAACGTCHGVPPPAPHPAVPEGQAGCQACHAKTVDATGTVIAASAGGLHLNGQLDYGHPQSWTTKSSPEFHAFQANRGLATCQLCHGKDLDGGVAGVACSTCHGPSWRTTCTMCHGGTDDATGAPPKALWGYAGDSYRGGPSYDPTRIGAHTAHVTGSELAPPFDCTACHVKPADALAPGHVDPVAPGAAPRATVLILGLGAQGTTPSWDRPSATCASTYCHGATLHGGSNPAPVWTGGPGQAACGSCHGIPPPAPHARVTGGAAACSPCHELTVDPSGRLIPPSAGGKHLDGEIQGRGHEASWMDPSSANFHAFSADRDVASCTACHGASLEGGAGRACAACHTPGGGAPDFAGCTGCHGGVDDATGAPPRAIWGEDADPARGGGSPAERATRVGAHTRHLTGGAVGPAFDCAVCHLTPAAILSPGHIDAPTATVTFGGIATADGATPGWDRAGTRCAGTYCHGATLAGGSNTAPSWTGGSGEAACGACHGLPPPGPHPAVTGGAPACNGCHAQTVDASGAIIPASAGGKHVNGKLDGGHAASWMDRASPDFHAYGANRGLAACQGCHGVALDGAGAIAVGCTQCHGAGFATTCTMCHGGVDNATGAPPKAIWGYSGDAVRVGAHTRHVVAGNVAPAFDCSVCHVKPGDALAPGHVDALAAGATPLATVTFGGVAIQGVGGGNATWTRAGATCASTYCHGNFPGGNTGNRPVWTGGPTQGACGSCHGLPPASPHPAISGGLTACNPCHGGTIDAQGVLVPPRNGGLHLDGTVEFTGGHDASWMDQNGSGFHAYSANRGLASCQLCHGANLDGVGGSTSVGCQQCHGATWRTNCVMCHGGGDNQTGAPPKATWGQAGDLVRVGAHTPHVTGSDLAPAFDCAVCHVKPADAFTFGHIDAATASVVFDGLAAQGTSPVWTRSPGTCASVYCHGATLAGGSVPTPVWTAGASQGACGACHGVPPPPPHPAVTGGTPACSPCHNLTVDATGAVIAPAAGGKHLDGAIQVTGHDASWMDRNSPSFHAFSADRGLASCRGCHGPTLDGGAAGVSCAQCHGAAWKTTCTMCHGGGENQTGAPPKAIWGYAGDATRGGGTADPVRVGAHTAHLAGSALAPAFDCVLCHVKPASADDGAHIDEVGATGTPLASLSFSGIAAQGTTATWTRAGATCNTYCHGATLTGGTNPKPVWTGGAGQATCGTCHGVPPPAPHPAVTGGTPACYACHGATVDAAGNVIPPASGGKHLDGTVEATGHGADWMIQTSPGFHAFTANQGLAACTACHGAALEGGTSGVACASCHTGGTAVALTTCVACHGGTDSQTGAPPKATWGFAGDPSRGGGTLDPVRVGAHTIHLAGSATAPPYPCETCHVKPAALLAAGHVDQPYATVTFTGVAVANAATPSWTRASATCASTYCHGAFTNGSAGNQPVWTGGSSQAACGTCHGTPPGGTHPSVSGGLPGCSACHNASIDASGVLIPPAQGGKHANGVLDVTGHGASWMDKASTGFHAYAANQGLASCQSCHGPNLDGGSAGIGCADCHGPAWRTTCTMCHGGVDNATGAPPSRTWGHGDPDRGGGTPDPVRVGAHTAHLTATTFAPAYDCTVCHDVPIDALSPGHVDQPTATVAFHGLAAAGGAAATWNRASPTCGTTYCHGNFRNGNAANQPDWTQVGQGQAACGTCHGLPPGGSHPVITGGVAACAACHPDSVDGSGNVRPAPAGQHLDGQIQFTGGHDANWMNTQSPSFHAFSANAGLASCRPCHGQNLDGVGGTTSVSCASCHRPGGQGHDFGTCIACHGGTDTQSGAPPAATWGFAGDPDRGGGTLDPVRVGAHTIHLAGSAIAPPFLCETCHAKPATWLDAGHVDQPYATLTFSQLATAQGATPSWTRASATCASTYCHGAFAGGNAANLPVWTGGAGQAACGTCHGTPPTTSHPAVSGGLTACNPCHSATVDASGVIIPPSQGGKHLDGVVEATGHDASWMDKTSSGFHAYSANQGLAACGSCHGATLDGGSVNVACASCHGPTWKTSCTMCHGGVDNTTGAPPGATWGHGDPDRGGGTLDPIRVGAHTTHVMGGTLSLAIGCEQCHVKPADALAPGHVDAPTATVTFSGLAAAGSAPPSWTRSGATCASTYCHGGYAGTWLYYQLDGAGNPTIPVEVPYAGKNATPTWTGGPMACDSCHDNPPRTGHWHDGTHEGGSSCQTCHSDAVGTANGIGTGITDPSQHVNGKVDVNPNWIWLCIGCH